MNKNIFAGRQGDVMVFMDRVKTIKEIPVDAVLVPMDNGRVVLAYGKVTGHSHSIYEDTNKVKLWAVGMVKYIEVMAPVMLKHEEHFLAGGEFAGKTGESVIPPGIYMVPVQVEYTPQELHVTRD